MTKGNFFLLYSEDLLLSVIITIVTIFFGIIVFRKHIKSIFDPLFLHILMSYAGYSVVLVLFWKSEIDNKYLISFFCTQISFVFGFLLLKPMSENGGNKKVFFFKENEELVVNYIFYTSLIVLFVSQLAVYSFSGIPLLKESRLETFSGGGGFGVLNRFIPVCSVIVTTICIQGIFFNEERVKLIRRVILKLSLFIVVIFALLSGSKSGFLSIIFTMFFVSSYVGAKNSYLAKYFEDKSKRIQWLLMILAFFSAVCIVLIQTRMQESRVNPLLHLAMRFVSTGDVFMYAYPNNTLEILDDTNGWSALFKDILGFFRFYSWSELPVHLGLNIYQTTYESDLVMGPNARHNIFNYHYFGLYYGCLISFVLGVLVSFLRNKLPHLISSSRFGLVVFVLFAIDALAFEVDPPYAISLFFSKLIVLFAISIFSYYLARIQRNDI